MPPGDPLGVGISPARDSFPGCPGHRWWPASRSALKPPTSLETPSAQRRPPPGGRCRPMPCGIHAKGRRHSSVAQSRPNTAKEAMRYSDSTCHQVGPAHRSAPDRGAATQGRGAARETPATALRRAGAEPWTRGVRDAAQWFVIRTSWRRGSDIGRGRRSPAKTCASTDSCAPFWWRRSAAPFPA